MCANAGSFCFIYTVDNNDTNTQSAMAPFHVSTSTNYFCNVPKCINYLVRDALWRQKQAVSVLRAAHH